MNNVETKASIINEFAKGKLNEVLEFFDSCGILFECYAYKSRIKSLDGLIEKVSRKQIQKPSYNIDDITDVIGIRFVVLFKKDIVVLIEKLVNIILSDKRPNNPFLNSILIESIYYKGNTSISNISEDISNLFRTIPFNNFSEKNSQEGYSSVHIVLKLAIENSPALTGYRFPIEIQIRTVFEDAWGEIDHKYGYMKRRSDDPSSSHPTLNAHLETLKKFVDACVDYADLIVAESEIQINPNDYSDTLLTPVSDNYNEILKSEGINEDYIKKLRDIVEKKEKIMLSEDINNFEKISKLKDCLQEIIKIKSDYISNFHFSDEHIDIYIFYCMENQAFCNLVIKTDNSLIEAVSIYKNLHDLDTNNPIINMRYAQALGKAQQFDKSIDMFKKSFDLAKDKQSKFPVSDNDRAYVQVTAPKLTGYYIWQKLLTNLDEYNNEEILSLYQQAYDETKKAYNYIDIKHSEFPDYENNLTYYLTEMIKLKNSDDFVVELNKHLLNLEDIYKNPEIMDASTVETLLNSNFLLKNREKSLHYANILKKLILINKNYDFTDKDALATLSFINKVESHYNENIDSQLK